MKGRKMGKEIELGRREEQEEEVVENRRKLTQHKNKDIRKEGSQKQIKKTVGERGGDGIGKERGSGGRGQYKKNKVK